MEHKKKNNSRKESINKLRELKERKLNALLNEKVFVMKKEIRSAVVLTPTKKKSNNWCTMILEKEAFKRAQKYIYDASVYSWPANAFLA